MISIRLEPADEARLDELAAARGETPEEAAGRLLAERLGQLATVKAEDWADVADDDLAKSCMSLGAKILPPEDWTDEFGYDGGGGQGAGHGPG